jgi:hypothetical protein
MQNILLENKKHAQIKIARIVLNDPSLAVTYDHISQVKIIFDKMLHIDNMSPSQIKDYFNIEYSDFGTFLRKCLGLKLKLIKNAVDNYYQQSGTVYTDAKFAYRRKCQFKFDPYRYQHIPGYELLIQHGIYNSTNVDGMTRDHMYSIAYGFLNNIDPDIISHPANCQFISMIDNSKKNGNSCISYEQLIERIDNWNTSKFYSIKKNVIQLHKTNEHKLKLSLASSKHRKITNGIINRTILKTDPIPHGFRIGITRKLKMVA